MANWNYDPRINANSQDPEVRQLQQAVMEMARTLRLILRDIGEENMSPEFLREIKNAETGDVQTVKNKEANVYMGADGVLFKILK